ncbi:Death domain [Desmophyllum pertusum]|uniref:Death domain n=1 Tax=Desmophyllum pertusum TaxID=174260 RepID=A0A9X0D7U9_9CNID|nr:Death domain [Desmophyllum pertusum]
MEAQILIVLTFCSLLRTIHALNCPDGMYYGGVYCCKPCPAATYLKQPCNVSNGNSFCEPCPRGTYMNESNNKTACKPCKKCGPSQVALVPCKPSENRQCGCQPGKFHDPAFLFCMDCLKCIVGEGVVSPCTQTTNTKCQPCTKGTFSDIVSNAERCMICSKCEPAGIKEECNATRDTICEPRQVNISRSLTASQTIPTMSLQTDPVPTNGGSSLKPIKSEEGNSYYIIGISGAMLVVICVVVAIYCVLRRRCDERNIANENDAEIEEAKYDFVPATTSETPAHARSSHGLRGRRTKQSGHQREPDSQGSSGSLQGVSIGNDKTLIRDLPAGVYLDLGRLLNPKSSNNWVKLAGHLEFTTNDVKNLELFPDEATQSTLEQWGQRDGSTVDVLISVLKK